MSRKYITTALRDTIAAHLRTDSDLLATGAQIITRERGQIPSSIAETVASLQLAIVIPPAIIISANPNQAPLFYDKVRLSVRVVETALNQSGYEAEEIAELLHCILHSWSLPADIPGGAMLFSEPSPMTPGQADDIYYVDCHFAAHGLAPFPSEQPTTTP